MSITKEEGGRLNAFAKEPRIELIDKEASSRNSSWLLILSGVLLLAGLIGLTIAIS